MKYKLTLLALLIPTAVFAQSKGITEAAGFYDKSNPGQQAGYNNTARAAGQGPNNVTPYSLGNVYLNAGLYGAGATGIGIGGQAAVTAATPGATSTANTVASGTAKPVNDANKFGAASGTTAATTTAAVATNTSNTATNGTISAGNTVASGTTSTANTVASGTTSTANTVASGTTSAAKSTGNAVTSTAKKATSWL